MPEKNYYKKVIADMQKATAQILEQIENRTSGEEDLTMNALAEVIDKTPSSLRNKITGHRSFSADELHRLALYLEMSAAAKSLNTYIELLNLMIPIIEALPISPKLLSKKNGMSHHEFYRKMKGESTFTVVEIDRFSQSLEFFRDQLTQFIQNPVKAVESQHDLSGPTTA